MRRRAVILLAACALAAGCGGGARSSSSDTGAPSAPPSAPRSAAVPVPPPAPDAPLPVDGRRLARRLAEEDAALRAAIRAWRRASTALLTPPPRDVTLHALYVQRALRLLSRRPGLAAETNGRLPPRAASAARAVPAALRELRQLSAGWPPHRVSTGPAEPLGVLAAHYRLAQRRFGVSRHLLAAVNLVESEFGRLRNESVAGAQGPMQFMPATWGAYGMGGDIRDPHDAVLGAANLLRANGAPADVARALHAYNPSALYVSAVRRYARLIARDPDALPMLYSFQVYAGAGRGGAERRLTGPRPSSRTP